MGFTTERYLSTSLSHMDPMHHCYEPVFNVYIHTSRPSPYDLLNRPSHQRVLSDHSDTERRASEEHPDLKIIRKPAGEAYRPGRGGYNLDQAAKWTKQQSEEIKVNYHRVAP